jgi:stage II sporulation protein E
MEIELILFPCQQKDKCYFFITKKLEEILDIPFYKLSGKCSTKECVLVFKESERYTLKSSVKQHTKEGSEKSGDNYSIKTLDNSNRYIALCDGSGSGKTASEYSANTIKLLEEFLKTGFSKSASIKLINSSLIFNSENDYFSTIDLSIMDLKSGELEIIKKGACPTYIKRANGEFEIIRDNSFPLGVTESETNAVKKLKLKENDIIVMISDGINNALTKEDWVIEALKAINSDDPDCISDIILKIAMSTEAKDKDDMTVITSKVLTV